jgi:hypothetical protein
MSMVWGMKDTGFAVSNNISQKIADGTATQKDLDDFMLFSPFALEDIDQELVMLGAVGIGLYLSKTDRGMKLLETMVKSYFSTIADIVGSMAKGGSTHVLSSLNAQMITTRMIRRLGLISNDEANIIHHETIWTINKIVAEKMLGDISHAVGTVFGGIGKSLMLTRAAE